MEKEFYIHNESGKLYSIVQWGFMFKQPDDSYRLLEKEYSWREDLVLYKAEYENPKSKYFSRTIEDFNKNFTKVIENVK